MDNAPVKVLYVAGLGRSGSTILANTLGQVEGFFSGGELNFIWKHALIENRLCGCGRPARECPFWGPVFDEEFGGRNEGLAREMMRLQYSGARTRHIPLMLTEGGREKIRARLGKFLDNTGRLYKSIRSVSGSRVVVDTSKEPAYGYALGMVPGIDLRVLHLVRDPRAAAYSWAKKKRQPDSADREFMHQKTPAQSAVLWDAWNAAIEALWRESPEKYLRLRYEDFIADPRASFEAMLKLVGEEGAELPLVGEREVKLGISHTVSGNPNRFDTGAVELKQDQAWTEKMSPRDQKLVTALTVPLLKRYHYPLA
ncbi:MAG: sulfotransferase [Rubrobacter sp.]|nr:sulfotransferase [Rubrobacter sp.]MBA3950837.1 sulfotransferase [Rubrobacter sp.]MDQ3360660.1 sulfotransferase [Actinomycetota bacterium]